MSTTVSSSSDEAAALPSRSAAIAAPSPAGPISSHSPGPEPTTRTPSSFLADRPKRMRSSAATRPPAGALACTLASGAQSVRVSAPDACRSLTSQPYQTVTGGAGAIGLRASGIDATSDTHPPPVRVDMRVMLHDPRLDKPPAGQPHRHLGAWYGQAGLD